MATIWYLLLALIESVSIVMSLATVCYERSALYELVTSIMTVRDDRVAYESDPYVRWRFWRAMVEAKKLSVPSVI